MTIEGDVVAVHSHWTEDGSRIVTEATLRRPDGGSVVVSQLGGTVDGIAMRQLPGPEPLVVGMAVAVAAHHALDLEHNDHLVLDSAKVMAYPPEFVRTGKTTAGHYLYWKSGCAYVTVDAAGTTAIAGNAEFSIIDASITTWNEGTDACSYFKIINAGTEAREVGRDNVNLIKFRDVTWGRPAIGKDAARDYEPAAAAITTAIYINDPDSARDGEIIDADIEINGVNFAISVDQQSLGSGDKSELQNTLTHELGHLQGLEHPCWVGQTDPMRVDGNGDPVPSCSEVMATPLTPEHRAILQATMFNFQSSGETSKESLSQDDIDAICAVYPIADDPDSCEEVSSTGGGCCSAARDRPGVSFLLAGTTLMLVMRRRRKAKPGTQDA